MPLKNDKKIKLKMAIHFAIEGMLLEPTGGSEAWRNAADLREETDDTVHSSMARVMVQPRNP